MTKVSLSAESTRQPNIEFRLGRTPRNPSCLQKERVASNIKGKRKYQGISPYFSLSSHVLFVCKRSKSKSAMIWLQSYIAFTSFFLHFFVLENQRFFLKSVKPTFRFVNYKSIWICQHHKQLGQPIQGKFWTLDSSDVESFNHWMQTRFWVYILNSHKKNR